MRNEASLLLLIGTAAAVAQQPPALLRTVTIDGLPGYISIDRGQVLQTTALDIRDGAGSPRSTSSGIQIS